MNDIAFFKAGRYSLRLGEKTYVMAILNVTSDSFSDGGKYIDAQRAVKRVFEIQDLGADIIDIGAQSTRPGFKKTSPKEELLRLMPVLKAIKGRVSVPISVDTFYPCVAKEVLSLGVDIINDVCGFGGEMIDAVKDSDCGLVVMSQNRVCDIRHFFEQKYSELRQAGISAERICFDPGIGFGKTLKENRDVIRNLESLKLNGAALLVGASKKSFLNGYIGGQTPEGRKFSTIAVNILASERGADIIRVHDVLEAVQSLEVTDDLLRGKR